MTTFEFGAELETGDQRDVSCAVGRSRRSSGRMAHRTTNDCSIASAAMPTSFRESVEGGRETMAFSRRLKPFGYCLFPDLRCCCSRCY
jgi:hypothetical protein